MKAIIKIMAACCLFSVFGCAKIVHTHEEVLGKSRTKDEVLKQFGQPAERYTDSTEQWLYVFQKSASQSGKYSRFTIVRTNTTKDVQAFTQYQRVIIFTFDKQGVVTASYVKGVDLAERKFSAAKTIGLIVGLTGVLVISTIIIASSFTFSLGGFAGG